MTVTTSDDLLDKLDAGKPTDWDTIYAAADVVLTEDHVRAALALKRPCAHWLALRLSVGPPGRELPEFETAAQAVLVDRTGTAADAWVLVMHAPEWPENLILTALIDSAQAALSQGRLTFFAAWLAARAAMAALVMGRPEWTWQLLDQCTPEGGELHPHFAIVQTALPLRGHDALEKSGWVRAAYRQMWPAVAVPSVRKLPLPEQPTTNPLEIIEQLNGLGATQAVGMVEAFMRHLDGLKGTRDDEPLVIELRRRVMSGESEPPAVETLPDWFADWVKAAARRKEYRLLRLAGLLLHSHGVDAELAAVSLRWTLRFSDLPIYIAGLSQAPIAQTYAPMIAVGNLLPAELADALIAVFDPEHVDSVTAFDLLVADREALEAAVREAGLEDDPGMQHTLKSLRSARAARVPSAETQAIADEFLEAVRRETARLPEMQRVSTADIDGALARLDAPEATDEVFWAIKPHDLPPLEGLLASLALDRRTPRGDLKWLAQGTIMQHHLHQLLPLRRDILTTMLEDPQCSIRPALTFSMANTIRGIGGNDERSRAHAEAWFRKALNLANREGDFETAVDAELALMRMDEGDKEEQRARLDALLALVPESRRGDVLWARARVSPLDEAVERARAALEALPVDHDLVADLVSFLAQCLMSREQLDEASALLAAELQRDHKLHDRALLSHVMAKVHSQAGRHAEAKVVALEALALYQAANSSQGADVRLTLLEIGLASQDTALFDEHDDALQAALGSLGKARQHRLLTLEAHRALVGNDVDAAIAKLRLAAVSAPTPSAALSTRLSRLNLRIQSGSVPDDAEQLLMQGLQDAEVRAAALEVACNHGRRFSAALIDQACIAARALDNATLEGRSLYLLGRRAEAANVLRRALDDEDAVARTAGGRAGLIHQLLICLVGLKTAPETLRSYVDELERFVQASPQPSVRSDLAETIRYMAQGDADELWRAWGHAHGALGELAMSARPSTGRVLVAIIRDLLTALMREVPDRLIVLAEWLLSDAASAIDEREALRQKLAMMLLVPGKLTRPDALDAAGRLVEAVRKVIGDSRELRVLANRLDQVQAWADGRPAMLLRHTGDGFPDGPFDDAPPWLVSAARGEDARADRFDDGLLSVATMARADAADFIVAAVLRGWFDFEPQAQSHALAMCAQIVSTTGAINPESWRRTEAVLQAAPIAGGDRVLREVHRKQGRGRPSQATDVTDAVELFKAGVHCVEAWQQRAAGWRAPADDDLLEGRRLLGEAIRVALAAKQLDILFHAHIAMGNALKVGADADVAAAIESYRAALEVSDSAGHSDGLGKLQKVWADALLMRGREGDVREAWDRIGEAIRIRKGTVRAEAQATAAQVAARHPDWSEADCAARAVRHLLAGAETDSQVIGQPTVLEFLAGKLAEWLRLEPDAPGAQAAVDQLARLYPNEAETVERLRAGFGGRPDMRDVADLMQHTDDPNWAIAMRIRGRLKPNDALQHSEMLPHNLREGFVEAVAQAALQGDANAIQAAIDDLDADQSEPGFAGRQVAIALLRAELVRLGQANPLEVRADHERADAAVAQLEDGMPKALLLDTLAEIWAPEDDLDPTLRDFDLAVRLADQAVAMSGGPEHTVLDLLERQARSLLYALNGSRRTNLTRSVELYAVLGRRARSKGMPDLAANALRCQAVAIRQQGEGGRLERLERALELDRQALELATNPAFKSQLLANTGWSRTEFGTRLGREQGTPHLRQAIEDFDAVDLSTLTASQQRSRRANRTTCAATLARWTDGFVAEKVIWEDLIDDQDFATWPDERRGVVLHNYAAALLSADPHRDAEAFCAGIRVGREALRIRKAGSVLRFRWETAYELARQVGRVLMRGDETVDPDDLPWLLPEDALKQVQDWLRIAIDAAREMGGGERLADAAFCMAQMACLQTSSTTIEAWGGLAWVAIREALPTLLFHEWTLHREKGIAYEILHRLTERLAAEGSSARHPGLRFAMTDGRTATILKWLLRAQAADRRTLAGRASSPPGVDQTLWLQWRSAVAVQDTAAVASVYPQIEAQAPGFLTDEASLEPTWRWLRGRRESVAITVTLGSTPMAVVLHHRHGRQHISILGIDARLRPQASPEQAAMAVLRPVLAYLDGVPGTILWNPTGRLSEASPSRLFPGMPCALTTALALPDRRHGRPRARSTLIALADPDGLEHPSLDDAGKAAITTLARVAKPLGDVRQLGPRTSAKQLLNAVAAHDLIVVIAHAADDEDGEPCLICVTPEGRSDPIPAREFSQRHADAFDDAKVILLSCSAGRVGDGEGRLTGIAGGLISAGARVVVAPMVAIKLSLAVRVAAAVLEGMIGGREPWDVIAAMTHEDEATAVSAPVSWVG